MPTAYEFFHTNCYPLPKGIREHGHKKITAVATAEEKGIGEVGQAVGVMLEDGTILTSSRVFGGLAQSEEDFAVLECLEANCHESLMNGEQMRALFMRASESSARADGCQR